MGHGGQWVLLEDCEAKQHLELNWYPEDSSFNVPYMAGEGLTTLDSAWMIQKMYEELASKERKGRLFRHFRMVTPGWLRAGSRWKLELDGKNVAELRVNTICNEFSVIDVDAGIAREGAMISSKMKLPMADALIMATAKKFRVACVTDDPQFTVVKRVWV